LPPFPSVGTFRCHRSSSEYKRVQADFVAIDRLFLQATQLRLSPFSFFLAPPFLKFFSSNAERSPLDGHMSCPPLRDPSLSQYRMPYELPSPPPHRSYNNPFVLSLSRGAMIDSLISLLISFLKAKFSPTPFFPPLRLLMRISRPAAKMPRIPVCPTGALFLVQEHSSFSSLPISPDMFFPLPFLRSILLPSVEQCFSTIPAVVGVDTGPFQRFSHLSSPNCFPLSGKRENVRVCAVLGGFPFLEIPHPQSFVSFNESIACLPIPSPLFGPSFFLVPFS